MQAGTRQLCSAGSALYPFIALSLKIESGVGHQAKKGKGHENFSDNNQRGDTGQPA